MKSHPVDQQSSGFPDNFILEDELVWLDGMFGQVIFQLEEGMKPFAMARKDGRAVMEYDESGCLRCRHGLRFL
jgi:hypothetical protein